MLALCPSYRWALVVVLTIPEGVAFCLLRIMLLCWELRLHCSLHRRPGAQICSSKGLVSLGTLLQYHRSKIRVPSAVVLFWEGSAAPTIFLLTGVTPIALGDLLRPAGRLLSLALSRPGSAANLLTIRLKLLLPKQRNLVILPRHLSLKGKGSFKPILFFFLFINLKQIPNYIILASQLLLSSSSYLHHI